MDKFGLIKGLFNDEQELVKFIKSVGITMQGIETHAYDALDAFAELHQELYGHEQTDIVYKCLEACKDYYYAKGYKELIDVDVNDFIEAIYFVSDCALYNGLDPVRKFALQVFGEQFEHLFTEKTVYEFHDGNGTGICLKANGEALEFFLYDIGSSKGDMEVSIDYLDVDTLKRMNEVISEFLEDKY